MLPVNQILQRNIALFNQGKWLFINPPDADFFPLCLTSNIHVLHQTVDVFNKATNTNKAYAFDSRDIVEQPNKLRVSAQVGLHSHEFAPFITSGNFDQALLFMPKSKSQFSMLMHMALSHMNKDGCLYIVGDNKSGIKSITKLMQPFGNVEKVDSARHCTLLCLTLEKQVSSFNPNDYLKYATYELGEREWECASFPGVFSEGALDEGTALFLQTLPLPLHGRTLDFASGAGVISCFVGKALQHISCDLLDVSAIALYCAAHSLKENQLHGTLIAANGLQGVTQQYQCILTNPPFHTGTKTDYAIVTEFINTSVNRLKKGGNLYVVANRFLPYTDQLKTKYSQVDVLAQNNKFSVYKCA
ncbi:methyltransferase [Alteromonas sediminis]|nr:methyltransferase [Alteromonas sediminis]